MSYRVLAVDDEPSIVELVAYTLRKEGFEVLTAANGREALHHFNADHPDLILLDLMLPDMDGVELCRRIRRAATTPILILSAKDAETDKIRGLEVGADDYIVKPFSPRELVARVKAALRRANLLGAAEGEARRQVIAMGALRMDLDRHEVLVDGTRVDLRPKEFDLLAYLLANPNRVLSREAILHEVWGYDVGITRTVDVHVRRLRQKLFGQEEANLTESEGGERSGPSRADLPQIETVHGVGYRLLPPPEALP